MKFMFFSIKYRYSDILLKRHKLHLSCLFYCNNTCYCVIMVSVTSASLYKTSASRYHPRYQSRSSMYIRGLIPRNFAELAEAVPIGCHRLKYTRLTRNTFVPRASSYHDRITKLAASTALRK